MRTRRRTPPHGSNGLSFFFVDGVLLQQNANTLLKSNVLHVYLCFSHPPQPVMQAKKKQNSGSRCLCPKAISPTASQLQEFCFFLFFLGAKGRGGKCDQKKGENTWQSSISLSRTRSNRGAAAACRRQECSLIDLKAILVP